MIIARVFPKTLIGLAFLIGGSVLAAPATASIAPAPLAIVGPDTLTTTDLKIELGIMENQQPDGVMSELPSADRILRRLVQNRLVLQEGYRMGLHEEFTVANQVLEFVRHKTMAALLDSVAGSVPADVEDRHEARRKAVDEYLTDLRQRYHVSVDSTLLASLDYGSADPEVQKYLREDTTVLAVVPTGTLTVAGFSRILRFTEFHGLVGKVNANEKRDQQFRKWLSEAVLYHQVTRQKMSEQPRFATMKLRMEESLVLQETLRILLDFEYTPSDKEVEAYYEARLDEFTAPPRVKMESLKVAAYQEAVDLREKMLGGAPVGWLKKNVDAVVQGPAPFPAEFFAPEKLGLKPDELEVGRVPEPYQVPSGWVVAKVVEIEDPQPIPLQQCRADLLLRMKADQTRQLMGDIIARLEEATPIEILPDAEGLVAEVIQEFAIRRAVDAAEPQSPSQEG